MQARDKNDDCRHLNKSKKKSFPFEPLNLGISLKKRYYT